MAERTGNKFWKGFAIGILTIPVIGTVITLITTAVMAAVIGRRAQEQIERDDDFG